MSTTFNDSFFKELDKFTTPNFDGAAKWEFHDADEELAPIAEFIHKHTPHNSQIDPARIKFYYVSKPIKEGGRYIVGNLKAIGVFERDMISDFDYYILISYAIWKNLDSKNKAIQLDKVLCGVELAEGKDPAEVNVKKHPTEIREYENNVKFFGADTVLNSSEIVHRAGEQIAEAEAEDRKQKKEAAKEKRAAKADKTQE